MGEGLTGRLFFLLSAALIAVEFVIVLFAGMDIGMMLLVFFTYVGLSGMLFSLFALRVREGSGIESVSSRRARALREGGLGDMFEGYDIDDEFLDREAGAARFRKFGDRCPAGREEIVESPPYRNSGGERGCVKRSLEDAMSDFARDRSSFEEYIARSMGSGHAAGLAEESFCLDLDTVSPARESCLPPVDFSHDPAAFLSKLKKTGGRS